MRGAKIILVEILVVGAIGTALGFTVNALRASDTIDLGRNYFAKGGAGLPVGAEPATPESGEADHPDHPYQNIKFDEVVKIFNDPATDAGAYVFVDARNDQAYEEGHIPGAIQADHYRLENYIETVLDAVETAEKVIVYCNGGDCEDSIFMCKDLVEFGVPYDIIYLYAGGWHEWEEKGQPVAPGSEQHEDGE